MDPPLIHRTRTADPSPTRFIYRHHPFRVRPAGSGRTTYVVTAYCASGYATLGRRAPGENLRVLWCLDLGNRACAHPLRCFGVLILLNLVRFVMSEMRHSALVLPKQFKAPCPLPLPDVVRAVQCTYMSYVSAFRCCYPAFVIKMHDASAHASKPMLRHTWAYIPHTRGALPRSPVYMSNSSPAPRAPAIQLVSPSPQLSTTQWQTHSFAFLTP